ncbi:MAG: hypothetical protein JNK72_21865 [Myxococcales bacterium]|nr:hypothetical protein [Myxococcales bacterium]
MRLSPRVIAPGLIFVATVLSTGVATRGVYARGFDATLSAGGVVALVAVVASMYGAAWVALCRVYGLSLDAAGLSLGWRRWPEALGLAAGTLLGYLAAVWAGSEVAATPFVRRDAALAPGALVLGWLSFFLSSALQQLSTQALVRALSPREGLSWRAVGAGVLLFVAAHLSVSQSPRYLGNVALFALVSTGVYRAAGPAGVLCASAAHGAFNFAQLVLMGAPIGGERVRFSVYLWPTQESVWLGGANGFDEGWFFALALVVPGGYALLKLRALRAKGVL